jgi:hypothetical protein
MQLRGESARSVVRLAGAAGFVQPLVALSGEHEAIRLLLSDGKAAIRSSALSAWR